MATAMDFTAHRYNEILKLVQGGLDPSIAVAAVEAHGGWPTDSHRRMIAALAGLLKQPEMEVKAATLATKQVLLYPRDPETNARDATKVPYVFRLLTARQDHADFNEAMEMWVSSLNDQVELLYAGATQWGEVHPLAGARAPGTKTDFEEATRAFLLLIGTAGAVKLHNSVTNFFATKQQLQDRADKAQAEAAIEATAAEKAREAERIKAEKPTPTFSEHVLFELVEKVEKATGFLVFPNQVNNTQCATKLYDCLRRDRLPAAPDMLPDQSKPFMAMDGTVYGYPSKVVATATSGDNGGVTITLPEEQGETRAGLVVPMVPASMAAAHASTSRWLMTVLVVAHNLPSTARFKMSPQAALAYLNMLWQVAMYRNMTLERFMIDRSESLRQITTEYNKCTETMDVVLGGAQKTLYADMSTFAKVYAGPSVAFNKAAAEPGAMMLLDPGPSCVKCVELKKSCEDLKAENVARGKRINILEEENGKLRKEIRKEANTRPERRDRDDLFRRNDRDDSRDRRNSDRGTWERPRAQPTDPAPEGAGPKKGS